MSGLFRSLNIGSESLLVSRQGVDTTGHNIANAQTEGYSRQKLEVRTRIPSEIRGLIMGNGAYAQGVRRAHDAFVEKQLVHSNKEASFHREMHKGLKTIGEIYSPDLAANVSEELSAFFSAIQDLANFPEELTARTAVKETAKNVTLAFQRVDKELRHIQSHYNERVNHEVSDLNKLVSSIAKLNVQINQFGASKGSQANDLLDERDRLVRELATKINIHYYEDENGMLSIRGPKEVLLVDKGVSGTFKLERNPEEAGRYDVYINGPDEGWARKVSDDVRGGTLHAILELRDKVTPDLIDKNNRMAASLVENFNRFHREGFGLRSFSESSGRDFFVAVRDPAMAAQEIELDNLIESNTDAISAASTPMSPGDNVIINAIAGIHSQGILGGASLTDFYADYVGSLGLEVVRSDHLAEAEELVNADLMAKRDSVSGVSLDEEATNLLRWQTAFTASSRIITTVDEMLETVLSMKR